MKKQDIKGIFRKNAETKRNIFLELAALLFLVISSCQQNEDYKIEMAGPLTLSASKSEIILTQKQDANEALNFAWTTGSNQGTGSSISYVLQVDKKGNNFAHALTFDMGKAVYAKSLSVAELNDDLLNHWNLSPDTPTEFEARIVATIYDDPQKQDMSPVFGFSATAYQPVSTTLYIIGDASPNGWDAGKAIAMTPKDSDPTIFVYQGSLGVGNLKFITTQGQFLPSYNKGADDSHIVYRTADSQPDDQFAISEAGVYKVTVSLLDLTVTIVKMDLPPYSTIYMVGDASPNGWDIGNATPLVQDPENPYIFTYTGVMQKGDFKFPVNRNTDWGQDMYMKVDDTHMYLHKGGASDDNKWSIAKKGYYTITLDLLNNTITMDRLKLYMVGSATPIGWSIDKAVEMTEDATDGCIFTYNGPMVAGEFKFPVNRNTDWGQDMYMRVDDTHMYRHVGGASDDNKWNITADGNYVITANVETLTMSLLQQ